MSSIKYELFGSSALISSYNLTGESLMLIFPDGTDGFVRIGARIYKLNGSKAQIDVDELDDGPHSPFLFTSSGEYKAMGFTKSGRTITLLTPSEEELRKSILRVSRLESNLSRLEKHINSLQEKIEKATIF